MTVKINEHYFKMKLKAINQSYETGINDLFITRNANEKCKQFHYI